MKDLKDYPLPLHQKKRTITLIRFFDITFSLAALIFFAPLLFIISLTVKLSSKGKVFFQQVRVGKDGKDFLLFKFRTMCVNAEVHGLLTVGGKDKRITNLGYYLRRYKLDELPQLWNVLKGNMSIVGPRPEVRKYVELYTESQKQVLTVKPGLTDYASIEFRNESEMLSQVSRPEEYYIQYILPRKIELNKVYINNKTIEEYFEVILKTQFSLYNFRNFLIRNKITPKWGIFLIDLVVSVCAMVFANFLLHEPNYFQHNFINSIIVTGVTCSIFFFILKPYDGIIRYSDVQEAIKIFSTIFFSFGLLLMLNYIPVLKGAAPFYSSSSLIMFFFIASVFMLGYRILVKGFFYLSISDKALSLKPLLVNKQTKNAAFKTEHIKLPKKKDFILKEQLNALQNKKILITGASGIIGRQLAKQLTSFSPVSLILCDVFETGLYNLSQELQSIYKAGNIVKIFIGDAKDSSSMNDLFSIYQPDIVFHTAGCRYINIMERNPSEAVCNNIEGAKVIADLSAIYHVERFLFVSTNKNKKLLNIVDASNQITELYCSFMPDNASFILKEPFIYNNNPNKEETKCIIVRLPDVFFEDDYKISLSKNSANANSSLMEMLPYNFPRFIRVENACISLIEAIATGSNGNVFTINRAANNNNNVFYPAKHSYQLQQVKMRDYTFSWGMNSINVLLNAAKAQKDIDVLEQIKKMVPEYDLSNNPVYQNLEQHNFTARRVS